MLIQAKSKNEAKGLFLLFTGAGIINMIVIIHAFLTDDVMTIVFGSIAGVLALVMTIQMKAQAFTDSFNYHTDNN